MNMANEQDQFPSGGINRYVNEYIRNLPDFDGKVVVDVPCGDGRASYEFIRKNATVKAFDLYPEFMKVEGLKADYADLTDGIPLEDNGADIVICQEGIEHVPDQVKTFREFNRILKKGGKLILTTPSMSHIRARLSWFFLETDFWRRMPPTEIDSIWFSEKNSDKIYYGHIFLLGVHQLTTLATLTGFKVEKRIKTDIGTTSLILGIPLYPFYVLVTLLSWLLYRNKNEHVPRSTRTRILWDRLKLNLSPKTLFCKHLFWILKKNREYDEVVKELRLLTKSPN